ncbi:MAG TPA: response regulator [Roseiflexaceae bacterium]|nr:response regulator [Roseiflexaceae bacterium]
MPAMRTTPPLILIIDDDDSVRRLLVRMSQHLAPHCEVVELERSIEVLTEVAARQVSLVIADYNMPDLNGIELAQAVKAASPATQVAIISGLGGGYVAREAKAAAAEYFLNKPLSMSELTQILERSVPPCRSTSPDAAS